MKVNVFPLVESGNIITTIKNCARCDETHHSLEFTKFSKYPIVENDGTIYDYWCLCPTTEEPILLRVMTPE